MNKRAASRAFTVTAIKDGQVYDVRSDIGTLRIASGATSATLGFTAYCYVKSGSSAPVAYACYFSVYLRTGTSQSQATRYTGKVSSRAFSGITVAKSVSAVVIYATDTVVGASAAAPTTFLAKTEIPVVADGQNGTKGDKGDTGPMCYIAGEYRDDIVYRRETEQTVGVEVATGNNTTDIYYLVADNNVDTNGNHIAPTDSGQSVWAKGLNEFNLIRTKYLFADFANLASFVMTGDWMYSQYGDLVYASGTVRTIDEQLVKTEFSPVLPVVLNGNKVKYAIIVCKVSLTLTAATTVTIRLTPSSEPNSDFGAVGRMNETLLADATYSSIRNGTNCLLNASGTTERSTTQNVPAGTTFFYVAYVTDSSVSANNDNVTIAFLNGSSIIDCTVSKVKATEGTTYSGGRRTYVPYGWFDPSDPMVETLPAYGCKFRPSYAVDGLTGEVYSAKGNFHVAADGGLTVKGTIEAKSFKQPIRICVTNIDFPSQNIDLQLMPKEFYYYGGNENHTQDNWFDNYTVVNTGEENALPSVLVLISNADDSTWRQRTCSEIITTQLPHPSFFIGHEFEIVCPFSRYNVQIQIDAYYNEDAYQSSNAMRMTDVFGNPIHHINMNPIDNPDTRPTEIGQKSRVRLLAVDPGANFAYIDGPRWMVIETENCEVSAN